MQENKIIESFFYKGSRYILYSNESTNAFTMQDYRDAKQAKQLRIDKGWDNQPKNWITKKP